MNQKISTWCVPSSIFCAIVWRIKERVPVRIAIQNIGPGTDHAQAEALHGDSWIQLTETWDGTSMAVIPYRRHYPDVEPYRTPSLEKFIEEQLRIFK